MVVFMNYPEKLLIINNIYYWRIFLWNPDRYCDKKTPAITIAMPRIFLAGNISFSRKNANIAVKTGIRLAKIFALVAPSSLMPITKKIKANEDANIASSITGITISADKGTWINFLKSNKRNKGRKYAIPMIFWYVIRLIGL